MKPQLKSGSPQSNKFKAGLLILAFLIIGGTLWYTHDIVSRLESRQQQVADLYARSLQYLASARSMEGDYSFVFDEIIRAIDFPIILTDARNEPIAADSSAYKNIDFDPGLGGEALRQELRKVVARLDEQNPPISVTYQDTIVLSILHYGESPLITRLRWLPYIEISIVGLFILIGYISFSYIKRSEQSNIWIGMARETAHQLGTPISSMMGWVELLKERSSEIPPLSSAVREMENDLQRLQKVADRFSKIGSKPDLKEEDLFEVISRVVQYFERRIPQTGKRVKFELTGSSATVRINRELFEWVLENLIKNALDAIENGEGKIIIAVSRAQDQVSVDVTDSGKGIDPSYKKDIFRPGFSTKSRGWGLGLSLSQRIIESYHSGRLILKETRPGTGTTFRIRLKA